MEIELKKTVANLMSKEEKGLFTHLGKTYEKRYYNELYELQRTVGYSNIQAVNKDKLKTILSKPWTSDGREFSQRIWGRGNKLINSLYDNLQRDIIRSAAPDESIKNIAKQFNASKFNAGRLVMTETAAISSKAALDSYREIGVEKYEILATLDLKTSEICREMDGKVFECKDYKIGITAPPFHPNCRSDTIPYYDDMEDETRMMRNSVTGKSERIENLSYKEWYEKYVVSEKTLDRPAIMFKTTDVKTIQELKNISKSSIINIKNYSSLNDYFKEKLEIELIGFNKKPIEDVKITLAGIDDIANKFPKVKNGINRIHYNSKLKSYGKYHTNGLIEIGPKGLSNYNTGIHEAIHALDYVVTGYDKISLSETVSRKALKNLKLRINGRNTEKLVI